MMGTFSPMSSMGVPYDGYLLSYELYGVPYDGYLLSNE